MNSIKNIDRHKFKIDCVIFLFISITHHINYDIYNRYIYQNLII